MLIPCRIPHEELLPYLQYLIRTLPYFKLDAFGKESDNRFYSLNFRLKKGQPRHHSFFYDLSENVYYLRKIAWSTTGRGLDAGYPLYRHSALF